MKKMSLPSWHPDEVTARFILVVGIFVAIGISLLSLDRFQARILSSVRAYVTGEGFYSKSQKDAVFHLQRYAASGDESEYQKFLTDIAVPLGDNKARLALQSSPPDREAAREGFIQGRNSPEDVERLIWLFTNFRVYPDMERAISIWTRADTEVAVLRQLGDKLHREILSGEPDPGRLNQLLNEVETNNAVLATLENRFSEILGATADEIDHVTGITIITATLVLLALGILLASQIVDRVRRAQSMLVQSEARFRHVVDSNIIGIMFWYRDGTIFESNDAFLSLVGYERSDLGHINWIDMTPQEFLAKDEQVAEEIRQRGTCDPYEKAFFRKDGTRVEVYLGAAVLDSSRNEGVCFVLDISERRRLEAQVAQVQRMEAIGTLVGGIAHDFNNTLSAMLGNIQLARLESGEDPAIEERLNTLEKLSSHSVRIVQQLMTFSRKSVSQMSPMSLNKLVGDVHDLAAGTIPENVDFNTTITAENLNIVGDETQLQRMILNLIDNAREAVAGVPSPRISCMLDIYRPGEPSRSGHPPTNSELAHLVIRDNGRGMSRETLGRVFEPFYTTKGVGEGSGLGLSMVYGAIQTHDGDVYIDSTPGQGTRVDVYLPLSDREQASPSRGSKELPVAAANPCTVLLVDDNIDIRDICQRFLESGGHRVITAGDGQAGLALFKARQDEVDVLITDIVMPNMSGIQLGDQIRAIKPELPMIFITGYDPEQAIDDGLDERSRLLGKPFSNKDLIDILQEVLTERAD